jgi:hypothetical protein
MLTKLALIVFGIIIIVFGFLTYANIGQILYYAIAEIVIGLICAIIGLMAKKPQQ